MRCLFTLLLLLFASNLEAQRIINSYAFGTNSTLNTGLVAYWKLEEASGTRVDSEPTGTAQDLTDNNTVTQAAGIIGNAALFTSANSEWLSHADSADLSTGNIDFTVAAWLKFTTVVSGQSVVSHYSSSRAWDMRWEPGTGRLSWVVSSNGTDVVTREMSTFGVAPTNVWIFWCVSHDSVGNTIYGSVNNGTVNSVAHTTGVHDSSATFTIGANDGGGRPFDGAIDEVGFWKRTLTAAEITSLYNLGSGRTCCGF